MNYKLFLPVFILSVIFIYSFSACNKQMDEVKKNDTTPKAVSDTMQNKIGLIAEYQKNGNDEFLIVDTIQIVNSIDIINPVKDSIKIKIDNNTKVVFQTFSFDSTGNFNFNQNLDYPTFIKLISSKDMDRFRNIPFKFEIKNGITISIKEIYIP